ncbi:MAG: YicC family protein [Kiritimatiellae bacterium]|nr:YicC family protein [Kiritimatiellia bacterium]
MALTSMTGYGRGESSVGGLRVEIELSSVNRKQLDVRLNLPRQLASLESRVHEQVHKACSRGQISGVVRITTVEGEQAAEARVDEKLARQYLRRLRRTAKKLGVDDQLTAADLGRMPGVLSCEARQDEPARMWPSVRKALQQAVEGMVAMREREGAALEKDVARRLAGLSRHRDAIAKRAPLLVKRYRKALLDRLKASEVELDRDDPALIKDLALFAERSDITEELVRLDSHFAQFDKLVCDSKPVGRTMDFLCQEMFREINTIGSKASDTVVARHVIQFKAGLEAVREQIQNVE